jgi:hypothetical protein
MRCVVSLVRAAALVVGGTAVVVVAGCEPIAAFLLGAPALEGKCCDAGESCPDGLSCNTLNQCVRDADGVDVEGQCSASASLCFVENVACAADCLPCTPNLDEACPAVPPSVPGVQRSVTFAPSFVVPAGRTFTLVAASDGRSVRLFDGDPANEAASVRCSEGAVRIVPAPPGDDGGPLLVVEAGTIEIAGTLVARGVACGGLALLAHGDIVVDGTIDVAGRADEPGCGGFSGGEAGAPGGAPRDTARDTPAAAPGHGGSHASRGRAGPDEASRAAPFGTASLLPLRGGGGGGGASAGGPGGGGGGAVYLAADRTVRLGRTGVIDVRGGPGGEGAGSGAGGSILIEAGTIDVSNCDNCLRHQGGGAPDASGAGGQGRVRLADGGGFSVSSAVDYADVGIAFTDQDEGNETCFAWLTTGEVRADAPTVAVPAPGGGLPAQEVATLLLGSLQPSASAIGPATRFFVARATDVAVIAGDSVDGEDFLLVVSTRGAQAADAVPLAGSTVQGVAVDWTTDGTGATIALASLGQSTSEIRLFDVTPPAGGGAGTAPGLIQERTALATSQRAEAGVAVVGDRIVWAEASGAQAPALVFVRVGVAGSPAPLAVGALAGRRVSSLAGHSDVLAIGVDGDETADRGIVFLGASSTEPFWASEVSFLGFKDAPLALGLAATGNAVRTFAGVPDDDACGAQAGAVVAVDRVADESGNARAALKQVIDAYDAIDGDGFGSQVATTGDRVVVSSVRNARVEVFDLVAGVYHASAVLDGVVAGVPLDETHVLAIDPSGTDAATMLKVFAVPPPSGQ